MMRWMREQAHHLQPLWDGREANDKLCQMPFAEYLSAVDAVGSWCGNLEVYALSRGLPASLLINDYDSLRPPSSSSARPTQTRLWF